MLIMLRALLAPEWLRSLTVYLAKDINHLGGYGSHNSNSGVIV